jgi:molybdopterin synthase catalytic subunit
MNAMKHDRVELSDVTLDIGALYEWAVQPECGAVVLFSGTVRDHADGRAGVESLTYEAYREVAEQKMMGVVAEARRRYTTLGRVAVVHRVGELTLGESAVVVVVSAPHRPEAFDAARFCIDAIKSSVPIWKKERWVAGDEWGTNASELMSPERISSPSGGVSR